MTKKIVVFEVGIVRNWYKTNMAKLWKK